MASKDEIADEQDLFPGFPKSVSCDQCCNDRLTWVFPIALLQIAARTIHHNAVMLLVFADNFPVSDQHLCIFCAEVSVISPQAPRAHAIPFTDAFGVGFAGPNARMFIYFAWCMRHAKSQTTGLRRARHGGDASAVHPPKSY